MYSFFELLVLCRCRIDTASSPVSSSSFRGFFWLFCFLKVYGPWTGVILGTGVHGPKHGPWTWVAFELGLMVFNCLAVSAQPSTPVPRRPLPVCIQCHLQTTPSLCQPRSSRRASLSSQQLWSAGCFCGRPWDMELVTRQYERPSAETPSDVHWRRFFFSLLVYIAH